MSDTEFTHTGYAEVAAPEPVATPVPLLAFVQTLVGTPDEIWTRLMKMRHSGENRTHAEWHAVIDAMRVEPVH